MASLRMMSSVVACLVFSLAVQAEDTTASDDKASSTDWKDLSDIFSGNAAAGKEGKLRKAHHHHKHHKGEKDEPSRLEVCAGDYRENHRCQHEGFRICTKLMDGDKPYIFGEPDKDNKTEVDQEDVNKDGLDWWEWSKQPKDKTAWMKKILDQGGHHWCTCALCTSEAVDRFGCDKLDIICNASDVAFIRHRVVHANKTYLKSALECLEQKCGKNYQKGWPIVGEDCGKAGCYFDATTPVLWHNSPVLMISAATAFMLVFSLGVFFVTRRLGAFQPTRPDDDDASGEE